VFITKILRRKTRGRTYQIYIDGARAFELSDDVLAEFGLRVGDEITEKAVEQIVTAEARSRAQRIAINYLSYRPRSSKEVVQHLVRKGFSEELAHRAVDYLRKLQLLDDTKFAHIFVRDRLSRKPVGRALLRRTLQEKGIPPNVVEQVLRDHISEEDQEKAAEQIASRRLRLAKASFDRLAPERRRKRLLEYLLRRGFSNEIAHRTVRTILS
jgi:regulatory protein